MFTVFVLCYGDYPYLARRCLESLRVNWDARLACSLRVGLNAISPAAREAIMPLLRRWPEKSGCWVYDSPLNRLKYPLMRKLFNDPEHPIDTDWVVWFDDDSCLAPEAGPSWWPLLADQTAQADQLGHLWTMRLRGGQAAGIQAQPWFTGKPLADPYRVTFATGGWWAIRRQILQTWDYPWPALTHNGGDVMLGELIRQQGYRLRSFRTGLWINADERGQPSKAPRRGESRPPLWYNYPAPAELSYHDFTIRAYDPRGGTPDPRYL